MTELGEVFGPRASVYSYPKEWTFDEVVKGLEQLREPFPSEQVGKLPKNEPKEGNRQTCPECGGYHRLGRGVLHLDYIGHAWVCDRLDAVDPYWTMVPLIDSAGIPVVSTYERTKSNGDSMGKTAALQVSMTVLGITRYEVGQASMGAEEWMKNLYSDCVTRAAMRFGVGRYLWQRITPVAESAGRYDSEPVQGPTAEDQKQLVAECRELVGSLPEHGRPRWEAWKVDNEQVEFPIGATYRQIETAHAYLRQLLEEPF